VGVRKRVGVSAFRYSPLRPCADTPIRSFLPPRRVEYLPIENNVFIRTSTKAKLNITAIEGAVPE
jgi:hypothetical protein